jgi:hypothetical protein
VARPGFQNEISREAMAQAIILYGSAALLTIV